MDTLDNQSFNTTSGGLTPEMDREIAGTYSWMRFLAILAFIVIGLVIVVMAIGLAVAPFRSGAEAGGIFVGVLLVMLLMFFPALFLFQSGTGFKNYIETRDTAALHTGFVKSKALWRFYSIFMIIYLVLIIIFTVIGLTMGGSMMREF